MDSFEEIGDIRVRIESRGSGPGLVLVHGVAQDHRIWRPIQTELQEFSTIACDLRGHGESSLGRADGTLSQLAEDLIEILELSGARACVGFSLGGAIALRVATVRPDLIDRLMVIATSSVVGGRAAEHLRTQVEEIEAGGRDDIRKALSADTRSQIVKPATDFESVLSERLEAVGDGEGYANGLRAILSMRDGSLHERLDDVKIPVLALSAERDVVCPRRAGEILVSGLPSASILDIAGSGHLVTAEDPDAVVSAIRAWFGTDHPSGSIA